MSDSDLPPPLISHLQCATAHLFQDDTSWPLHSSRFYLGLLPPLLMAPSHPQHPPNPSPPSHNDSLLASLTPIIPPLFAWQRAFGDLSFKITSPRLGSPVPTGLLTETRSNDALTCLQPLSSTPLTVLTPLETLYSSLSLHLFSFLYSLLSLTYEPTR